MDKTLRALMRKHPDKIESYSNESDLGDGYWLYLQPGWCWEPETHCVHERDMDELLAQFKRVTPCYCEECQMHTQRTPNN